MEPIDTEQIPEFSSYFHHRTTTATTSPSTLNGLLPRYKNNECGGSGGMVYPHSVATSGVMSSLESAKRKCGRPRKYGTPEQALAAKKTAAYSNSKEKIKQREQQQMGSGGSGSSYSGASKKSQLGGFGNLGQGFTPLIISVAAGEDVGQKIMLFMQQSKHEICILSASGSICKASLRQPATSGDIIMYEVIVGTFQFDSKKDVSAGLKGDSSGSKSASPVAGASVSSVGFHTPVESYGRNPVRGNDDLQTIGGTHLMIQLGGSRVSHSSHRMEG